MEQAIPWQDIAGLRNILVHQYTDVNVSRIWLILKHDLPRLSEFVDCALDMLNKE